MNINIGILASIMPLVRAGLCIFLFCHPLNLPATSLAASSVAQKRIPKYVKEIIQSDHSTAKDIKTLLNIKEYRAFYARDLGFPAMDEYIATKTDEGMSESEASDLYEMMFIHSELSEHEIERTLTNNSTIRADLLATTFIGGSIFAALMSTAMEHGIDLYIEEEKLLELALTSATEVSEGLGAMILAIDNPNLTINEINDEIALLTELDSPLSYHDELMSQNENMRLKSTLAHAYTVFTAHQELDIGIKGYLGNFLIRTNHLSHAPISADEQAYFDTIGITDKEITSMFPSGFFALLAIAGESGDKNSEELVSIIGNDPARVGELDFAVIVDLIYEEGALSPALYSPAIATDAKEYQHVKDILDRELDHLGITMDDLVALLRHPKRPASLLQVLQLLHLGFSPEDITRLNYAARDAIIVSNTDSKEEFLANVKDTLNAHPSIGYINAVAREKGQLTFVLLNNGYKLEDIQSHYFDHRF